MNGKKRDRSRAVPQHLARSQDSAANCFHRADKTKTNTSNPASITLAISEYAGLFP